MLQDISKVKFNVKRLHMIPILSKTNFGQNGLRFYKNLKTKNSKKQFFCSSQNTAYQKIFNTQKQNNKIKIQKIQSKQKPKIFKNFYF